MSFDYKSDAYGRSMRKTAFEQRQEGKKNMSCSKSEGCFRSQVKNRFPG